jgi:hypothetical protein
VLPCPVERKTGIKDVVDKEDITSLKISPAVIQATYFSGRSGALVAGDIPEFDFGVRGEVAEEIDDKENASFQKGNNGQRRW